MGIGERLGPVEKLLLLKAGSGLLWVRLTALHPCLVQGILLDKKALCLQRDGFFQPWLPALWPGAPRKYQHEATSRSPHGFQQKQSLGLFDKFHCSLSRLR